MGPSLLRCWNTCFQRWSADAKASTVQPFYRVFGLFISIDKEAPIQLPGRGTRRHSALAPRQEKAVGTFDESVCLEAIHPKLGKQKRRRAKAIYWRHQRIIARSDLSSRVARRRPATGQIAPRCRPPLKNELLYIAENEG